MFGCTKLPKTVAVGHSYTALNKRERRTMRPKYNILICYEVLFFIYMNLSYVFKIGFKV